MSETKELLRRGVGEFEPMPDAFDRVLARRDRKQRNQRVAAGVLGIAVIALVAIGFVRLFGSEPTPATDPESPFFGVWVPTSEEDPTQTIIVSLADGGGVEVRVLDDFAPWCTHTPSTMTGTGRIEGGTRLVIPAPVFTCDGGTTFETPGDGPPLAQRLRDWTLVLDPQTDRLSDGFGGVWRRAGEEDRRVPLEDLEPVWPQTSLEEVRQAQELADAGDPATTWQLESQPWQIGQNHPGNYEIFTRFLEEKLGWEGHLWNEAFAHPDAPYGNDRGDVVFIRCAPGRTTNLMYPESVAGRCAPTIDDLRYETVQINVAQLDRQGPRGIWVVTGWEMIEPAEQVAPPSDAEMTAFMDAFFQARADGEGAEAFVDFAAGEFAKERVDRVPLLYATSTGAPYERSEFEVVDGPVWPEGWMQLKVRLFAENGETVVEQGFSLRRDETGGLRLVYGSERTTENGRAVPVEYGFLDGDVTYRAANPLKPRYSDPGRLTIVGRLPDDNAPRRVLLMLPDPRPIGPGCEEAPAPTDAEALAQSIRSDPDFEATAPVAVTIGGIPALQMDVLLAPGASSCPGAEHGTSGETPLLLDHAPFYAAPYVGDRARLYLIDLPGGSARVLAIATIADEDSFETVLEFAAPIVDSIGFQAS